MVRANSMTEAIRRAGISFIHDAEERMGRQVQLAGQRRMKVDAEPAVRPVVEQGHGIEQAADLAPSTGRAKAAPTTARRSPGCIGRPVRPRSGRSRRWWAREPQGRPQTPGASPAATISRTSEPPRTARSAGTAGSGAFSPAVSFGSSDSSVVLINRGPVSQTCGSRLRAP